MADLECVERIASRSLLDLEQDETSERPPEPRLEQPVENGERQRSDSAALERGFRKRRPGVERTRLYALPQREQHADWNALQPAECEGKDTPGALVDPLDVVEREEDGRVAGEFADQAQGGDG